MNPAARVAIMLGLALAICLNGSPVTAGPLITYVSNAGSDASDCASPSTACRTLQPAIDLAANGGTVVCLNSGDFAGGSDIRIGQSITIACTGHTAVIGPVIIQTANVVVVLRGLIVSGFYGGNLEDRPGIYFGQGNALHIENSQVIGFGNTAFPGIGIQFNPSTTSKLYVTDSVISENGRAESGGGIFIQPSGTGSARVSLNRVTMNQNTHGIVADGTGTSGAVVVQITDSVVAGHLGNGVWAKRAGIVVDRTSSKNNAGYGILADGPGSVVHLSNSMVVGNGAGLGTANGTGQIFSYGNNQTKGNVVDGAPTDVLQQN